jgi:DNA-binding response OmpR family regulator
VSILVVIVEDDNDILELIEYTLNKDGYETIGCLDLTNLDRILEEEKVDLILMDRNLPGMDGADYIKKIKREGFIKPVIFVTAKDTLEEKLEGFESGADDYITKPFNLKELSARVNAVLKRSNCGYNIIKVKNIIYKASSNTFYLNDNELELTPQEKKLLKEFITSNGQILSREYLIDKVWNDISDIKLRSVNIAVKRLKDKIEKDENTEYIKSIRGEGYKFC